MRTYPLWAKLLGYGVFCAALLVVPLFISDDYLLNKFSRYLVFGIVAGPDPVLGLRRHSQPRSGGELRARLLLHGHGAEAAQIPIQTGAEGLPDFMVWNNVKSLPWFWEPFHSYAFAIAAGVLSRHPVVPAGQLRLSCPRHRGLCRDHHAGAAGGGEPRHHRPAALHWRLQRADRSEPLELFGLTFDPYSAAPTT